MASFVRPSKGPATNNKGFQAQPARKTAPAKSKSALSMKAKGLGKTGKDAKAIARKAKALKGKKKGKKT